MSTFTIGDEVMLPQGHKAILRWIGRIPGKAATEFAGVEILGPEADRIGKHSGTYQGQQFFQTSKPNTGLFVSYTQLVSANVKPLRVVPDSSGSMYGDSMFGSPSRNLSTSPRRDSLLRNQPLKGQQSPHLQSSAQQYNFCHQQRVFFRDSLKVSMEKVAELSATFDQKLSQVKADYEMQLAKIRRSSALNPIGPEFEEQRLALAAMQNKLITERSEKQDEIDKLKNELNHMRKLTGSVEDLEALVKELEKSEKQLAHLRSQVRDVDDLKQKLTEALQHNAELELAAKLQCNGSKNGTGTMKLLQHVDDGDSKNKPNAAPTEMKKEDTVSRAEYEKLEKLLEIKLLKESELEAENEQLQSKLSEVMKQLQQIESKSYADQQELVMHRNSKDKKDMMPIDNEINDGGRGEVKPISTHISPSISKSIDLVSSPMKLVPVPVTIAHSGDDSIDLAAGRADWCSLCDRQGHCTVECPY